MDAFGVTLNYKVLTYLTSYNIIHVEVDYVYL